MISEPDLTNHSLAQLILLLTGNSAYSLIIEKELERREKLWQQHTEHIVIKDPIPKWPPLKKEKIVVILDAREGYKLKLKSGDDCIVINLPTELSLQDWRNFGIGLQRALDKLGNED